MTPEQLNELQHWAKDRYYGVAAAGQTSYYLDGFDDGLWALLNHIRADYLTR